MKYGRPTGTKNDNARKSETASVQERDGEKSIGRRGRGRDGRAVNSSRSGKTLKGAPTRQKVKGLDIELTRITEASISCESTKE